MISAWASGTGSAGIIGSISWAGLIALGVSPRDVLRIMLVVPLIQAFAFWVLLRSPREQTIKNQAIKQSTIKQIDIAVIESNNNAVECATPSTLEVKLSGLKAKLKFIPKLASFIAPLVIVFIFEYICVSGLVSIFSRSFDRPSVGLSILFSSFFSNSATSVDAKRSYFY